MNDCLEREHVDRHFAGTISAADERALRAHLLECDACRAYYGRHHLLAQLDPAAVSPQHRIGHALGLRERAQVLPQVAAVVALAACVLLWLRPASSTDGFTARGAGPVEALSRVVVYQTGDHSAPVRAGATLGAHDELAFSYENGAGKPRLMIFGTDEHAHVYWFYPAWTRAEETPVAVPIATDGARHELADAVRQPLDGKRLDVHALFLDGDASVREVEALLRAHPTGPLPIAGAIETTTSFRVTP